MTKDEVIAMAIKAGLDDDFWLVPSHPNFEDEMKKLGTFAALCCAAQREKDAEAATEAVAFNGGSVQMEAHVRAAIRGQQP